MKKKSKIKNKAVKRIQFECSPALNNAIQKIVKMIDSNQSWVVRTCLTVFFQERGLIPKDVSILPDFINIGTNAKKGNTK